MELTKELFQVPYKGRTFLYAPLEGSVLEVTPGVLGFLNQVQGGKDPNLLNQELTQQLTKARILREGSFPEQISFSCESSHAYSPTSVTLLPTYNCNLRCVYCYARAGEDIGSIMSPEIAKASIDFVVENTLAQDFKNRKPVHLGFHGGGEPLLSQNRDLLNYALDYTRNLTNQHGLKCSTSAVSNGLWSNDTFNWVVENLDSVSISLDGPKDIQDAQRPVSLEHGVGSFDRVLGTIQALEKTRKNEKPYPYGLRATITSGSVERMTEIVEFFHSISSNKSFHLEPLFECGRCSTSYAKSPDPQRYLENLVQAQKRAKELGVELYYSGGSLEKISSTFCGACGSNFFITPNGFVTSCLEACREEDAVSNAFFIGKYNPEIKKFDINQSRIDSLKERRVEKITFCEDCFAKYNCAGDCPAKVYEQTGDLSDPSQNWRCTINRGLLVENIANAVDDLAKDDSGKNVDLLRDKQ